MFLKHLLIKILNVAVLILFLNEKNSKHFWQLTNN